MDEAAHIRELQLPSPATDPDIQEALSLRYSDQVVILLRLRSGNFAVYNNMRELCGVFDGALHERKTDGQGGFWYAVGWPPPCWRPPPPPPIRRAAKVSIDLEELGLLK